MVCLLRYSNQLNVKDERGATRNARLGEFAVATHVLLLVLTRVLLLVLFLVTPIGCGIAGFTPDEIAPLFEEAVSVENIHLPQSFWEELV